MKVAILDDYQNVSEGYLDLSKLSKQCEFTIFKEHFKNEEECIEKLKNYNVLMVMRERTKISKLLINSLKNLQLIITSGMRNKAIDIEAATKKKIVVSGTDINSNPTAELTWALILGLSRNLKEEIDNMFQGYWQTTIGLELRGKILGVIGLGKIGKQVAKIGKAFGMQVVTWSENLNLSSANELGVLPMTKDELVANSDFISIHLVLSERTKNLFTTKEFEKMKKTAFLINTSRGQIVNEKDLLEALNLNSIAGVGLDVYEREPLSQDHKLRFLPNALILPHLGYVTHENYAVFFSQMIENLEAFIKGRPIRIVKS